MTVVNQWVGAVDDSSGWVRAKIEGGSGALFISTASDMTGETLVGSASATAQGVISIRATGLTADTTYFWQVEDSDGLRGPIGRFHTHGTVGQPYSYTFAAVACAGGGTPDFPGDGDELDPNGVSNHPAFDDVRNHGPLFTMHHGDMHYYNLGEALAATLANYRTAYDDVLDQPRQHELYYRVPLVYAWDDHDFDGNNSDGTFVDKANAAQVYRERVPHYSLPDTGAVYQSFQVGRVLHVVSDVRYYRDPNSTMQSSSKTMLGSAQKTWLDNLLATSDARALIWHMPAQWMGTSDDSWAGFRHERDELVQMFGDHGWLDRMCIVSGDLHALAISTGPGNEWGGFPAFQLASIDSAYQGATLDQYDLGGSGGRDRYGLVKVEDQGGTIRITGTGYIGASPWGSHVLFNEQPVTAAPLLQLDYAAGHVSPPFEPTEDDQLLANDVAAEREDGSSARVVKQTGANSVQAVGRYDESVRVNVETDAQLPDQAGWRVHLGTVDEPRYPQVTVDLARNTDMLASVAAVESGDRATIVNPPAWLPPGDVELLTQGYSEEIDLSRWTWTANTSPASPWTVAVADDETLGRLDTAGSVLVAGIDATQTQFEVEITTLPRWITDADFPGQFPFPVEVGGEVMTVTGVDATASQNVQLFTVTRSTNGVSKSHAQLTAVRLAQPAVIAL